MNTFWCVACTWNCLEFVICEKLHHVRSHFKIELKNNSSQVMKNKETHIVGKGMCESVLQVIVLSTPSWEQCKVLKLFIFVGLQVDNLWFVASMCWSYMNLWPKTYCAFYFFVGLFLKSKAKLAFYEGCVLEKQYKELLQWPMKINN